MPANIRPHHQRTIDRLTEAYRDDPKFEALIIGGSVIKGYAREDSDIDFLLVATDEEYARRAAARDLLINRTDLSDYDGGYVDGKVINTSFLHNVADRGNEATRWAFSDVILGFSRLSELRPLLERIVEYPEADRDRRVKTFYCLAFMGNWLMHEASRYDNRHGILRAASQLSLFSSRLLLAHNRILFPFHKWLLKEVEQAPDKPADFLQLLQELLEQPSPATAGPFFHCVQEFQDWGVLDIEAYTWFMTEVEWSWMNGTTPMEDW